MGLALRRAPYITHTRTLRHLNGRRADAVRFQIVPPRRIAFTLLVVAIAIGFAVPAHAFCGFFVSSAGGDLFASATHVLLLRDGQRTVLSMQNAYQGPPQDFAMVVPVPVVLKKEDVHTLPRSIFDRLEQLTAPRLVEYWEQDPCASEADAENKEGGTGTRAKGEEGSMGNPNARYGVKVEAEFVVGEYEIVVLSADDSMGLEAWLHDQHYAIPAGAEPYLRPYVTGGSKFFVARVDVSKVRFEDGRAMLSPLRFAYDSDAFALPIRLGLVSSPGTQDLVVELLGRHTRYEVANYPNVFVPTNLEVADEVRERFGSFYAALFDLTLARNPRAVVTEYAWSSRSCDPCPVPALQTEEVKLLGAPDGDGWVLTRLHARYAKDASTQDLVFRPAPPVVGGREDYGEAHPTIEPIIEPNGESSFQARYVIRHAWQGPVACDDPQLGQWGPPPGGREPSAAPARGLAFVARGGIPLPSLLVDDVPALDLRGAAPTPRKPWTLVLRLWLGETEHWSEIGLALGVACVAFLVARDRNGAPSSRRPS
jgi:hypothetical protein